MYLADTKAVTAHGGDCCLHWCFANLYNSNRQYSSSSLTLILVFDYHFDIS